MIISQKGKRNKQTHQWFITCAGQASVQLSRHWGASLALKPLKPVSRADGWEAAKALALKCPWGALQSPNCSPWSGQGWGPTQTRGRGRLGRRNLNGRLRSGGAQWDRPLCPVKGLSGRSLQDSLGRSECSLGTRPTQPVWAVGALSARCPEKGVGARELCVPRQRGLWTEATTTSPG